MIHSQSDQADRVELILQQLQSLPTLSVVATRLLQLTADDEADIRDVVRIIESDPTLTARVLSLCRRADKGIVEPITTVERAVVLLGFEVIRNAVLSVEIYTLFAASDASASDSDADSWEQSISAVHGGFDREGIWTHSIAVASACELMASRHGDRKRLSPEEAFVCGLLHDIGKLALDRLLPRSYERVVEMAGRELGNIAEIERRVLGLDHHTAGKRLAEQWQLPHLLQDVMWLHGQPYASLPDLPHRQMIGVVSLADLIVRKQHLGFSGNHLTQEDPRRLCREIGLDPNIIDEVLPRLHEQVEARAKVLGLGNLPSRRLFLESIARANQVLGRVNTALQGRSQMAARHERVLHAICAFHREAMPSQTVMAVCGSVVASAAKEFGRGFYAIMLPCRDAQERWQLCQFHSEDGRLLRSQFIETPPGVDHFASLNDDIQISVGMLGFLPWLSDYLGSARDIRDVRLLPLRCSWGLTAVLLHDRTNREINLMRLQLVALSETWASAIAAATRHEGAKLLGEQLAESSRILTETQARLARTQVMASLGEMAAGAAHEMNNPLTVISGRSQVLANELTDERQREMARQIATQAHRLSDLITSLHLFAEPTLPKPSRVDLSEMVLRTVKAAKARSGSELPIRVNVSEGISHAWIDQEQTAQALFELIINALEARPRDSVEVIIAVDHGDDQLRIRVVDDGVGMSAHTLGHAFDPFFSAKPAGRQAGLGLARAQRLLTGQGGTLELESKPGNGTVATIRFATWKQAGHDNEARQIQDTPVNHDRAA